MPKFQLNNSFYNIPDDIVNQFKQDNPDATLVEEPGKTTPTTPGAVVEETAAPELTVTESPLVDTSLESVEISNEEKRKLPYDVSQSLIRNNKPFTQENINQVTSELEESKNRVFSERIIDESGIKKFKNLSYNIFGGSTLPTGPMVLSRLQAVNTAFVTGLKTLYTTPSIPGTGAAGIIPDLVKATNNYTELLDKEKKEYKDLIAVRNLIKTQPRITDSDADSLLDVLAGVAGSASDVGVSVVPAMIATAAGTVTAGPVAGAIAGAAVSNTDLLSQFVTDFNIEKAKAENPNLSEDEAIQKLAEQGRTEFYTPAAIAAPAMALEYVGLWGITKYIASKGGITKNLGGLLWASNGEGFTESFQQIPEYYNTAIAKGQSKEKALEEAVDFFQENFFNTYINAAVGTFAFSGALKGAGYAGRKAWKSAKNMRIAIDEGKMENKISEIAELQQKKYEAKTIDLKTAIDEQIKTKVEELDGLVIKAASVFNFANDKDFNEINDLEDLKKKYISKVKEINNKKEDIPFEEYKEALEIYKGKYLEAQARIKGVVGNISNKGNKIAQEVEKIYQQKGKEGIAEILELYKPMAKRIASKYRMVPGFDMELITDEILTGKRGILDLINTYDPDSGVPLAAYVNKFASTRGIEAAQRILKETFEADVTEAKGVADTTTADTQIETKQEAQREVKKALAQDLNLSEDIQNEIVTAVEKTLGTKLPAVTDKGFKPALTKGFRTELTNTLKKVFGRTAAYEQFLRDNFEKIYPAIPQETINKKFKEFNEAVVDPETGKQLRERTAEGKKVFKKRDITKAEFIKYFLDAPGNVKGARKTSLAEVIADEVGLDNVLGALAKPEVVEKFKAIQELQGQEVPSNFIEIISEKIDRAIQKLEDYQKSGVFRSSTGIPEIIINSTIVFAKALKAGIKAGKTFIDALNDAIKKFRKSLSKKYNEEELDIAENIIREEVTENNIPDFLDLADIIENNIARKRGEAYEDVILKALKNANIKGLKILTKQARGSDRTKADITIEYNGKKANIEVKLNANAQYGSISLRANDNTLSTETSFKKELLELAKEKQTQIEAYKTRAVELGAEITGSNLKVSKKIHEQLKNEGLQAALQGTKNVSADIISEFYNNKGVYYIQIGESGLFHLGEDILNLGTTKFEGKAEVSLRIRRAGTGLNTLTFFPKLSNWNQLSNKTIDTESGIQSVFKENKSKSSLDMQFNELLQATTKVDWTKEFSPVKAKLLGRGKGKKIFIPYSADDFVGLLYATLGRKEVGNKQMEWYNENLLRPYSRAIQQYEAQKQKSLREWMALKKEAAKDVPGGLKKQNDSGFTNQDSVRMYIWTKQGMEIEGLDGKSISENLEVVNNNPKLKEFAERLMALNPEGYPPPSIDWSSGDITTDLVSYINDVKRSEYLTQWKENVAEIFNDRNKNKLRALYGDAYVKALDNMLYRMDKGRNRYKDASDAEKAFMNWTNNSVGAIMFFNARSAVLQTLSSINFINFSDNNPINASLAFLNQKQYWNDFSTLFNSDFLKQRRTGLQTDINADEIANAAATSKNKARAVLSAILKFGFTPTQIADSFAIASGGATMYRNRIKKYLKEGLSKEEAEAKAFTDFQEIAEETQQSARPDRISMQQAGSLGRLILAFGNTPMQYARLTKKATLDLINGRGDWKTNISKIAYYSVIQNIIFSALQQGMFALLFDDEDDEEVQSRLFRIGNSSVDTLLRGIGVYGAAAATVKNMIFKIIEESEKSRPDYKQLAIEATSISPPINSKLRKLESAGKTFTYKQSKEKVFTEGFSLENPAFLAAGKVISAGTNLPADRVVQKMDHIYTAMQPETELWQGIALSLGWSEWDLGMIEKQTKKESNLKIKPFKNKSLKVKKFKNN